MKKLLLSLVSVIAACTFASAQEAIIDFKKAEKPGTIEAYPYALTVDDMKVDLLNANAYIFTDTYGNYKNDAGQAVDTNVLFLKYVSGNSGAISFTLDFDCAKIVLKTSNGCSTASGAKCAVCVGDETIQNIVINGKGTDFIVETGKYSAAGTVYTIKCSGTKNIQFETISLYAPSTSAAITPTAKSLDFATPKLGEQSIAAKFTIENYDGDITVTSDNDLFAAENTTYTVEEAQAGINIVFKGEIVGEHEATLTFTAGTASCELAASAIVVENEGTVANPLTVADVLDMNNRNSAKYYVIGKIADKTAANAVDGVLQFAATKAATNLVLLGDNDERIGVALPTGETRTKLNIVDNEEVVGETVVVEGSLESYFGAPGVKNTKYVSGLSGVEAVVIESENNAVEYFNLQGVRVAQPTQGLYIVRQGSKVSKQIIR